MNETLQLIGSFATVWLLTWLLCLMALAGACALLRNSLRRWHPALAANLLLILLAFPFLLSLTTTALLFLPGTEAALVSAHCHDDCQAHAPLIGIPWLAEIGLLLILLITLNMARHLIGNLRAASRLRAQLALVEQSGDGYRLLDDPQPFVFTLGWWRNLIYITRGLLEECSAEELAIILAHEQAHVRRRDNVRLLLARLFLLPLPRPLRKRLFADLHLLIESACDFDAARLHGSTEVAAALLHVQKLVPARRQIQTYSIASAFTGAEVAQRIHALLEAPSASRWQQVGLQLSVLTLILMSFGLVDPLHHGIELLIGMH